MPTVVYLHGFLSSSASKKAQITRRWLAQNQPSWRFVCPDLPANPKQTKEALLALFSQPDMQDDIALIGSSLGGFWATFIAEVKGFPAVLVNPSVRPHDRFDEFKGQALKHYYRDEVCRLTDEDFQTLAECHSNSLKNADLYWLLAQKGDEVLDYKQAETYYIGCRQSVESGGSHEFTGYESWLPDILSFFQDHIEAEAYLG